MLNRPGIPSTIWFIEFVTVSLLLVRQHLSISPNNADMIFGAKLFGDSAKTTGDGFVLIKGTMTGDGLAHVNNTYNIACYKDPWTIEDPPFWKAMRK